MSSPLIAEFVDVRKAYRLDLLGRRKISAIQGVSFQIRPGEVVGLVGPNRAGKTTIIKCLLSLCKPDGGDVRRFGLPASIRSTLGRIGYVHENQAFPRYLTARAALEFHGSLAFLSPEIVQKRAPVLLDKLALADRADEPIAGFSKGMMQRLAIAQALLNEPDLLVLDEPNEGLDIEGRQALRAVVDELRSKGSSVLYVSHAHAEIERSCDRVIVMMGGRVQYFGPLQDYTSGRTLEAVLEGTVLRSLSA